MSGATTAAIAPPSLAEQDRRGATGYDVVGGLLLF
jgi:hypothetical protein